MNYQPALATSALRGLHDELVAYVTLFCDERDLLQLAQTNSGTSSLAFSQSVFASASACKISRHVVRHDQRSMSSAARSRCG